MDIKNSFFYNLSIKRKLMIIIMLTSSFSILLACAAFVVNDYLQFRTNMERETQVLAQMIGNSSTASLLFNDRKSAEETLSALSAQPRIAFACLYSKDGQVAATYQRDNSDIYIIVPKPEADGHRYDDSYLHMFKQISLYNEPVGKIYLKHDLKELDECIKKSFQIVFCILSVVSCLALLISSRLQRVISSPLLYLANVVGAVSREKDYSIRAVKRTEDEIGKLIDGFNEMLGQVQERDTMLEQHREQLEEKVAIRTAELRKSNRELLDEMAEREKTEKALASEKERLAVTLRSIGDGVIVTDTDGRIVLSSSMAEEITGWEQDLVAGMPLHAVFKVYDKETRDIRTDLVEEALSSGIIHNSESEILVDRKGNELLLARSSAPVKDQNGDYIGVILVFRDITEKQKLEEQLLKARKLDSIGVLAGGIAHDFNNLLTAILGNISLAKMIDSANQKLISRLTEAENASLRARNLTQQLLTFSKGGAPITKTTNISGLLKEAAGFTLAGANVKCDFILSEDLWPVDVDEGQISQVINNLVLNACQAMPGGGKLSLRSENIVIKPKDPSSLHEGRYVKIAIEDHGEGIDEEHLLKIFDPYFTTKEKGSGLGLATCYSIIKRHHGLITVMSKKGMGTLFNIFLPASSGSEAAGKVIKPEQPQIGSGKVLLMDDEEMIRDVAGEMLGLIGYDVVYARDGAEALEKYLEAKNTEQPIDAVIMDLTIPGGMGGLETMKQLLDIDANVKAVVSSGYAHDPIMSNYAKWGFSDVISKPYKIEEFSRVLHRVTGSV